MLPPPLFRVALRTQNRNGHGSPVPTLVFLEELTIEMRNKGEVERRVRRSCWRAVCMVGRVAPCFLGADGQLFVFCFLEPAARLTP